MLFFVGNLQLRFVAPRQTTNIVLTCRRRSNHLLARLETIGNGRDDRGAPCRRGAPQLAWLGVDCSLGLLPGIVRHNPTIHVHTLHWPIVYCTVSAGGNVDASILARPLLQRSMVWRLSKGLDTSLPRGSVPACPTSSDMTSLADTNVTLHKAGHSTGVHCESM